jgi:hypothetical protein
VAEMNDGEAMAGILEPPLALATGAVLGGFAFLLLALLFGPLFAVDVAVLGTIIALVRRLLAAAVAFGAAAALAAGALVHSTAALFVSSAAFGIALALFARARLAARLSADGASSAIV